MNTQCREAVKRTSLVTLRNELVAVFVLFLSAHQVVAADSDTDKQRERNGTKPATTSIRLFQTFHGNLPVDVATTVQFSSKSSF